MPLNIECENGHKLVCPDSLAGSSVICPQCGSRVDVSARNVAKGGRAFSDSAKSSLSGMSKAAEAPPNSASASAPEEIAFVCPNGHRLTGPRTLQGRAGECPKCGARFRVPLQDEPAEESVASQEEEISLEGIEEIDVAPPSAPAPNEIPAIDVAYPAHVGTPQAPFVQLFAAIWREREHGGLVELHLEGGEAVAPDWWSEGRSTGDYGLFALQTDEKTYEIQAIPWAHVRRVTVRRLGELPGGVFEGT